MIALSRQSRASRHILQAIPISRFFASQHDQQQRVYVVFGGYGAIGSALCGVLHQDNAVVVAVGHDPTKLECVQAHDHVVCDVLDSNAVADVFQHVVKRHGSVDGVANCVGNLEARSALTTSEDEFLDVLRVNLVSCFNILRPAVKAMTGAPDERGGSIAFISAAVARFGLPNYDAFAAAKGGVIGLTLGAASSYARNHIRVNCVAPGLVRVVSSTVAAHKTAGL